MFPVPIIRRKVYSRRFINAGAMSPSSAKSPEEVGSLKGVGLSSILTWRICKGVFICLIFSSKEFLELGKVHY